MDNDKIRMDLSLDELDMVLGGTNDSDGYGGATEKHFCKKCNRDQVFYCYSGTRSVCSVCGTPFIF